MKKTISIALAIMTFVFMMIPLFSIAQAAETMPMYVDCPNGKRLNVRETPGGKILYRLENGAKVHVLSSAPAPEGWAYITFKGRKNGGYVMTRYLTARRPAMDQLTLHDDCFVTVNPYTVSAKALSSKSSRSVGLRVSPDKSSQTIRRLTAGDTLQVIASGDAWSRVIDEVTGMTGYVANEHLLTQK